MNAKHTPGPWHWPHNGNSLRPVNPDPERSAVSEILFADGGCGFLGRSNSDTLAELEADRRLIAAAPLMLEALEAQESLSQVGLLNAAPGQIQRVAELRRIAIAAATGEAA